RQRRRRRVRAASTRRKRKGSALSSRIVPPSDKGAARTSETLAASNLQLMERQAISDMTVCVGSNRPRRCFNEIRLDSDGPRGGRGRRQRTQFPLREGRPGQGPGRLESGPDRQGRRERLEDRGG